MSTDEVQSGTESTPVLFPGKPQYLYRYCNADRALQILRDNYMYLAPPSAMNDLIEGTPARVCKYSKEQARELDIRRYMTEGLSRRSAAELIDAKVSVAEQRENFEYFANELVKIAVAMREHSGLISLSEAFNHQKMWGTYGDNHSGACIQFWRDSGQSRVHKHALPVEYSHKDLTGELISRLEEDGSVSSTLLGQLLYLRKTPEWQDEHEWRITMLDSQPVPENDRKFHFSSSNIRRVFLGPRVPKSKRDEIHALCGERDFVWSVLDVQVDAVTGISSFHGVELHKSLEDFEWHADLALPDKRPD